MFNCSSVEGVFCGKKEEKGIFRTRFYLKWLGRIRYREVETFLNQGSNEGEDTGGREDGIMKDPFRLLGLITFLPLWGIWPLNSVPLPHLNI